METARVVKKKTCCVFVFPPEILIDLVWGGAGQGVAGEGALTVLDPWEIRPGTNLGEDGQASETRTWRV